MTTHWTPVTMYPVVNDKIRQGCLYEAYAAVAGTTQGPLPEWLGAHTETLPILLAERHTSRYQLASYVTGRLSLIGAAALVDSGFRQELHDELKDKGKLWFLDATDDESLCYVADRDRDVPLQFWGGIYACGHLELAAEDNLNAKAVLEAIHDVTTAAGYAGLVKTRIEKEGEPFVFLFEGLRIRIESDIPVVSIHADADLSARYRVQIEEFDTLVSSIFRKIVEYAKAESVSILNPNDIDFTTTDGAKAMTVLRSASADAIADPASVALREWHRLRNASGR